jgi:hypothetical protein
VRCRSGRRTGCGRRTGRFSPAVIDPSTAAAYLRRERELTLPLICAQPWTVLLIEDTDQLTPGQVQRTAQEMLGQQSAART